MLLSAILGATFLTTDTFLGYSPFASASPTLAQSDGAINITTRNSLSGSRYIPSDNQCTGNSGWESRVCWNLDGGDGEWSDLCTNNYAMQGWCTSTEMCRDIFVQGKGDPTPKRTITCVPRATQKSEVMPGRQIGVIVVKNGAAIGTQKHVISVPVTTNLASASVSAVLEGPDEPYPAEAAIVVGTLRGTTSKLCDFDTGYQDCVPTVQHSLTAGRDIIDFTVSLAYSYQSGRLYYAFVSGN